MAFVNPPSGFNYNSASQRGQLSNLQRQMANIAPGTSVTPPSSALTSGVARAQFIAQTQRQYSQWQRGHGSR